jgi:hypothetical protein
MTRNLKALGLALIATFAMSAVAASGAQAVEIPIHLTPSEYPAIITGHQIKEGTHTTAHKFQSSFGKFECEQVTVEGTIKDVNATTTVTVFPTYKNCFDSLGRFTTFEMTHCGFSFKEAETVSPHEYIKGTTSLECVNPEPNGETPHIEVFKNAAHTEKVCEYTVTPFDYKGNITYTNTTVEGQKKDVDVTTKIEGIKLHRTFGSLLSCGAAEQTYTYTGTTTLQAYKDIKFEVKTQTPTTYTIGEGTQLDLTVSD